MIQIYVLVGPSASGKTTLKNALEMDSIITYTTRMPRNKEVDGIDYLFVSKEKFEAILEQGKLFEHTSYHDHYYGMGLEQVEEIIRQGRKVVVVLDLNGARKLKSIYPDQVFVIGANASYEVCEKRLKMRQDLQTEIRLSTYDLEMKEMLTLADLIITTNPENEKMAIDLCKNVVRMFA